MLLAQASFPVAIGVGVRLATFELSIDRPWRERKEPYYAIPILVRRIDWRSRRRYKLRWIPRDRLCIGDVGRDELRWLCPDVEDWVKAELVQRRI
jgi:hypothetical protein